MWVIDIREETNPMPVSTFFPDRDKYFHRAGRFGAHNILENIPAEGPWANIVFLTYFNAGLRAVDVSDPLRPKRGRLLRAGACPDGQESDPVERHRRRRARPALSDRPLGRRHAHPRIHRVMASYRHS